MDSIKKYLEQPLIAGGIGLIGGIFIGLVILGWWLWPVKWEDALPEDLTTEYVFEEGGAPLNLQEDYLRMSIDSFAVNGDVDLAQKRYGALGENAGEIYAAISQNPGLQNPVIIEEYGMKIVGAVPEAPPAETEVAVTPPEEEQETGGGIGKWITVLCVLGALLLVAAAAIYFFYIRRIRGREDYQPMPATGVPIQDSESISESTVAIEHDASAPPVAQFMASYKLGDELYDDSFSIDSPIGEFLGECGVGVSETIGVGETQKVTAFEIWLFDKNDIQTVTKVLMSAHAYEDEEIRQRLSAKGEPVMVSPGGSSVLETQSLYMMARVVDMGYGDGAMPPESYFDRFVLELSVWAK